MASPLSYGANSGTEQNLTSDFLTVGQWRSHFHLSSAFQQWGRASLPAIYAGAREKEWRAGTPPYWFMIASLIAGFAPC